jgi:hypothetical protein
MIISDTALKRVILLNGVTFGAVLIITALIYTETFLFSNDCIKRMHCIHPRSHLRV